MQIIVYIKVQGNNISNDEEIANTINNYFCQLHKKINEKLMNIVIAASNNDFIFIEPTSDR